MVNAVDCVATVNAEQVSLRWQDSRLYILNAWKCFFWFFSRCYSVMSMFFLNYHFLSSIPRCKTHLYGCVRHILFACETGSQPVLILQLLYNYFL